MVVVLDSDLEQENFKKGEYERYAHLGTSGVKLNYSLKTTIGEVCGMLPGQRKVRDKVRDAKAVHGHAL
jgi:hypothetical protein